MTDRIPISAAALIGKTHDYDQVIIYARRVGDDGLEWVTTWGKDRTHCAAAARIGDAIGRKVVKPLEDLIARAESAEARFDLAAHLRRQRDFSEKTFGPGLRTHGVLDHIRKELREIEADPNDIMEWVDVIILAFDGAWRAGWEPEEIVNAIVAKQTRNESRSWPDWRKTDPNKAIEHNRNEENE